VSRIQRARLQFRFLKFMRYVSTRGGAKPQPFTVILLEGLAPDGGLFLPEEFPKLAPPSFPRCAA